MDTELGDDLPDYERYEVRKIFDILQEIYSTIHQKADGELASRQSFSESKIDKLFDKMMLKKLQDQRDQLTIETISEMRYFHQKIETDTRSFIGRMLYQMM